MKSPNKRQGYLEIVRCLLEMDADANLANCNDNTPLWVASWTFGRQEKIAGEVGGGNMGKVSTYPRWWQLIFFFTPKFGEDSQFDEYFSNGLKPPTSYFLLSETRQNRKCLKLRKKPNAGVCFSSIEA